MSPAREPIAFHAPAKINLALHVTGRRDDGYHLLETLAVFAGYGDRVTAVPSDADGFAVSGPFAADVPFDASNLVLKARDLLRAAFPAATRQPVRIALEKNLPPASGIGGGSSDAAATLRALRAVWGLVLPAHELMRLAAPLGADLPMCVAARPLVARGIGERIESVERLPSLPLVVVNPGVPVATSDVFRRLARRDNAPLPPLPGRRDPATLAGWLAAARNDLETPAVEVAPMIAEALAAIRAGGAALARMSGSGATCFGLFPTQADAAGAARRISRARPGWWVVATQSTEASDART